MDIMNMITFDYLNLYIFFTQIFIFILPFLLFRVELSKNKIINIFTGNYKIFVYIIISVFIALTVKLGVYLKTAPEYSNFIPFGFNNCNECSINFILVYVILICFFFNFIQNKNKILLFIFFLLPIVKLISLDYNYFVFGIVIACLAAVLGHTAKRNNRLLFLNSKHKINKERNFLAILIIYWLFVVFVPVVFLFEFARDIGPLFLYLAFVPQLLCFIPYSIFYSKNKAANFIFLTAGLIMPCLAINYVLSMIFIRAIRIFGF